MRPIIAVLFVMFILTACGVFVSWVHPTASAQQQARDLFLCQAQTTNEFNVTNWGMYQLCMRARGYVREGEPLPSASSNEPATPMLRW